MSVIGRPPVYSDVMVELGTDSDVSLDAWTAMAFVAAGVVFAVFAGLWGAFAVTEFDSRTLQDAVGPIGWTVAFVGLLGVRRTIDDGWLARAGTLFGSLGAVGGAVTALGNVATLAGVVDGLPATVEALQLLLLAGIVLGFLAVAAAVARDSRWSGRVALLLAVPPVVFLANVVRVAALGATTPTWAPFVLGTAQAASLLAIGYAVRSRRTSASPVEQAAGRGTR